MLAAPLPMVCGMNLHSPRLWTLTLTSLVVLGALAVTLATGAANGAKNGGGHGLPRGNAFLPPKGKIFTGASDTGQSSDYHEFRADTRAHPAVMQSFESWGYVPDEALGRWLDTNTRGMLSLSTAKCWKCPDVISPQSIAEGKGDRYIVALAKALAHRRKPTYIRLMPEMNGYWNRYSAYGSDGQVRDRFHTTADFKNAWRRFVLIARGGPVKAIDRRLRKLRMPKLTERTDQEAAAAEGLVRVGAAVDRVPERQGQPAARLLPGLEVRRLGRRRRLRQVPEHRRRQLALQAVLQATLPDR